MCRSIQTLRPPYVEDASDEQVRPAALQYVRKVAGMRQPAAANAEAFAAAVDEVAAVTARLLEQLVVRQSARSEGVAEREAERRRARAEQRRAQREAEQGTPRAQPAG